MRMIEWQNGAIITLDQTKLPLKEVILEITTVEQLAEAIKTLRVRGAPLLGAAAGFGIALAAYNSKSSSRKSLLEDLEVAREVIKRQRPTAVNLFWGVDRVLERARSIRGSIEEIKTAVVAEAQKIADEDAAQNRAIGNIGSVFIESGDSVLTHCNAGELATVEYGTALGVIRWAWQQGKRFKVIADETRPLLQGARLTAYELKRDGIPVTLITDNMAGWLMHKGLVNKIIVGADRIVQDGVVNKIGTFSVAVLAHEHGIPFYVAAPTSTFDMAHKAADVIIEERKPEEVTHVCSLPIAPDGIAVMNPAFDVTPLKYVSAIICEKRIYCRKDYSDFKKAEA
jgi:methylthioribose-1-phosphate isomerase